MEISHGKHVHRNPSTSYGFSCVINNVMIFIMVFLFNIELNNEEKLRECCNND
jgi:hypothetical protein